MKTLEQVKEMYKSNTIDGRDLGRLAEFIPEEELKDFGLELKEEYVGTHKHIAFNRENILLQLQADVEFGAEKAYYERGISCWIMYEVVRMWNWILEEGLEDLECDNSYAMPYFIKTANKYEFDISEWL